MYIIKTLIALAHAIKHGICSKWIWLIVAVKYTHAIKHFLYKNPYTIVFYNISMNLCTEVV